MNRLKIAFTVALALIAGVVSAQDVTTKFNEAATLLGQKKVAEAIPLLEQVIETGLDGAPEDLEIVKQAQALLPECLYRSGIAAASAKNFDKALEDLSKAEELAELYGVMAVKAKVAGPLIKIYQIDGGEAFNNNDYAKAINVFSKGYAKFPNNTDIALFLAKSYAESAKMEDATKIYKEIMTLEDKHSKYVEPATQAKTELTQYIMIEASKAAAENNLEGVVSTTEAILSYDSINPLANMIRLQTANNAKDYDAVIGFGTAAAEAQGDDAVAKSNAYFLLGAAYQNKKNTEKAIEMYRKVTAGDNLATAKAQIAELSK